jgi:hypothetical protein
MLTTGTACQAEPTAAAAAAWASARLPKQNGWKTVVPVRVHHADG